MRDPQWRGYSVVLDLCFEVPFRVLPHQAEDSGWVEQLAARRDFKSVHIYRITNRETKCKRILVFFRLFS